MDRGIDRQCKPGCPRTISRSRNGLMYNPAITSAIKTAIQCPVGAVKYAAKAVHKPSRLQANKPRQRNNQAPIVPMIRTSNRSRLKLNRLEYYLKTHQDVTQ